MELLRSNRKEAQRQNSPPEKEDTEMTLSTSQQMTVAKAIGARIDAGTIKPAASGAYSLPKQVCPFNCTAAKGEKISKGDIVNFWISPERDDKSREARVYAVSKFFRRGRRTANKPTEAPTESVERKQRTKTTPTTPKTEQAPQIAPQRELAPITGSSDTVDAASVEHIIAAAKKNGAKAVTVAIVRF
jgi:hypothetical protein